MGSGRGLPVRNILAAFRAGTRRMAKVFLVSCVLISSLLAAALPQDTHPASPVEQAQTYLAQGRPEEAVKLLSAYLHAHPANTSARLLLAEAFLSQGQTDSAQEQYQAVLKQSPNNYIALAKLGGLYERAGRFDTAEPLLARAVKHSRGEPELRIEWAAALARLHRFREASQALAGVPAPAGADERMTFYRLKAAVAEGQGNASAAARQMESALALHPQDAGMQLATAAAELQARNWRRVLALAQPLFAQNQDPAAGLMVLEAQLTMRGDIQPTLEALRSLRLPARDDMALRQRLANILISRGQFAEAVKDLNQAANLQPGNPDLLFDLALAQFKAGQPKDALQTAGKCKSLRDSAELEDLLGDIQESLGDNLAAAHSYQAAIAQAPGNEDYRISLAVEFIRHENFEPAKLVLRQAETLFPRSWRIPTVLGMAEYLSGYKADASKILLQAASRAPRPQVVLGYLGEVELDDNSPPNEAAVAWICSFADAHPQQAKAQYYCGALLSHRAFARNDRSHVAEIERRLSRATRLLPREAGPHCELGRAYAWLEKWRPAVHESELCAQLDPESAQAHYRLAQVYRRTGQVRRAQEEVELFEAASKRLTDQNEQREKTRNIFLYTIQNQGQGQN